MTPDKFQHAGLDWIPHSPGDPMPCPGDTLVRVLLREQLALSQHHGLGAKAKLWFWDDFGGQDGEIIGWHPVEEQPDPAAKTIQHLCQDWAEDHSCAQRLVLSLGVPKTEVFGDNYGVPGIICLLEMIQERVAQPMATHRRAVEWHGLTDEGLRLRLGEMTAQEIRTVRAVLNAIAGN